jgi:hypothetical protein
MWLQKSDPIFSMGNDIMRPAYNFEPKYRVTMLTREKWTKEPRSPPVVKGLIWYTDGFRGQGGGGLGPESMGNPWVGVSASLWENM